MTSYSRPCGVHTADCAAIECRCVSVDGDGPIGAENGVQRFEIVPDVVHCAACEALAHDNPLQTAHNQSREDC